MIAVLTRLTPPLLCLILALVLLPRVPQLAQEQLTLLAQLPYVLLILAALMAFMAHQARELAAALLVLLCYWLIRSFLQASLLTEPAGQIFALISIWQPILLLLLLVLPDTTWRHPMGLIAILSAPLVTLAISGLFAIDSLWFSGQSTAMLADNFYSLKISGFPTTLFGAAILLAIARLVFFNTHAESSLLSCALLGFVTLGWFQLPQISAVMYTCIGILLVINQIRDFLNLGYRDELTQISNRRALHKAAKALRQNYSLAMVDIDHFKKINDTHGHDLGDQVLKIIANKLKEVGSGGKVYRYGGEEFCLLFNGKNADEIAEELEQLRMAIAEYDMIMRDGSNRPKRHKQGVKKRGATRRKSNIRITVSMGLADSSVADGVFERVMKAADNALYGAKRSGRNKVKVA